MRTVACIELKLSTVQRDRHFGVKIIKDLLNLILLGCNFVWTVKSLPTFRTG